MGVWASDPHDSRREFLKSVSLLALSGCALPVTARARTTAIPHASAPTDLLEEFGYRDVQLALGLPRSQFEHTQGVMLRVRGPQVLFALSQQPQLDRSQLLNVKRADDGYRQAGGVRFAPFTAIHDAPYTAYVRLA